MLVWWVKSFVVIGESNWELYKKARRIVHGESWKCLFLLVFLTEISNWQLTVFLNLHRNNFPIWKLQLKTRVRDWGPNRAKSLSRWFPVSGSEYSWVWRVAQKGYSFQALEDEESNWGVFAVGGDLVRPERRERGKY